MMNRHSMCMKVGQLALALVMALATLVPLDPSAAHARRGESRATSAFGEASGTIEEAGVERWWGVAGAVICGAEIRLIRVAPAIGLNPYVLAAGIGGCLLGALDVLTST